MLLKELYTRRATPGYWLVLYNTQVCVTLTSEFTFLPRMICRYLNVKF